MKTAIGSPPARVSVPIWAWSQYDGTSRKRPDLRSSGHLPTGMRGYRITFTIAEGQALLSDFDLWHYVLNYWYLPSSENDADKFNTLYDTFGYSWFDRPADQKLDRTIHESWDKVFDLTWSNAYVAQLSLRKSIQATLWQLELPKVTAVDAFIAR